MPDELPLGGALPDELPAGRPAGARCGGRRRPRRGGRRRGRRARRSGGARLGSRVGDPVGRIARGHARRQQEAVRGEQVGDTGGVAVVRAEIGDRLGVRHGEAESSRLLLHAAGGKPLVDLGVKRGDLGLELVDLQREAAGAGAEAEAEDVERDDADQQRPEDPDPAAAPGEPHDQARIGEVRDGTHTPDGRLREERGARHDARARLRGRRATGLAMRRRSGRGRGARGRGSGHQPASSASRILRAARRCAEPARGFRSSSSGPGAIARLVISSASGSRPQTQTGSSGGQTQPRARSAR